ncbi:cysteine desulfurase [Microbacterium mangrovi]|uniref:Cysteine desulfurase n=1 Tax=Microbacterium mangrovi TaxID=1348253 RepID=A0A0B2A7J8_9MICO|nr:cysteine desulfurase family protein [Microbacterium mangrovi]KHK97522.1 cysteine desulfurase [Microbacterium mangrovi]
MTAYLDHAASSPLRPEARAAWIEASEILGNPSSIHHAGQAARRILEDSRERLAGTLGCDPIEIVLTSGGTESVNLGITGLWRAAGAGAAIVTPLGEHHATMDTIAWLEAHEGARVRAVALDRLGRIELASWSDALAAPAVATALVANNEIGTVQPADALAGAAADAGVPLHLDAVGAFGHLPLSFRELRGGAHGATGLCALSVSAHKLGGPIGVGALVVARQAHLAPLLHGGGQQRGLRSGTQDAAGAAAFAVAAELAVAERSAEAERLAGLSRRLLDGVRAAIPDAALLGDPVDRLPGNVHLLFPGAGGEQLLFLLDRAGIAVSTGSACQAGVPEPSHVVLALGRTEAEARQVLRITLGRTTTAADVDALLAALPDAVTRARGR